MFLHMVLQRIVVHQATGRVVVLQKVQFVVKAYDCYIYVWTVLFIVCKLWEHVCFDCDFQTSVHVIVPCAHTDVMSW
jgi:hypothetical protein